MIIKMKCLKIIEYGGFTMSKTVVALFDNYNSAENAARQLKDNGFRTEDISIVARQNNTSSSPTMGLNPSEEQSENLRAENLKDEGSLKTTKFDDNISDGIVTGGILGGLAGLLIGAGSVLIPGLGIIAAAGPITGLISGAVTGGVVGGLVDLGIPETKGRIYEEDIKSGKVLFTMKIDEDKFNEVSNILKNNGAVSLDSY